MTFVDRTVILLDANQLHLGGLILDNDEVPGLAVERRRCMRAKSMSSWRTRSAISRSEYLLIDLLPLIASSMCMFVSRNVTVGAGPQ